MLTNAKSSKGLFLGGVVGLFSIIFGSCYYLYNLLPDDEDDEDIRDIIIMKNNVIDEDALMKIMIKIDQIGDKLYERDYKKEDERRRDLMDNSTAEYNELCKQQIENKQFINKAAADRVLGQLKTQISIEILQNHLKQIPMKKLEELSIKYYKINDETKVIPVEKLKKAYKYFCEEYSKKRKEIEEKFSKVPKTDTSEQEKAIDIMIMSVRIDDLLMKNYDIKTQMMNILLHKFNCFNTDLELKKLKEQIDGLDQGIIY